jgi:hypothetical protein
MSLRRICFLLTCAAVVQAADWSAPAEVEHDGHAVATYRAKLSGGILAIHVTLEPGWHTFALDNKQRAEEKLAGKKSLGIDQPTEIKIVQGASLAGPWLQPPPKDFSKPELRWYAWGFERQALFAAKAIHSGGPVKLTVRGQTCTDTVCKNVDLNLEIPERAIGTGPSGIDLSGLVPAR